jgi:hypothetical protein
MAEEREMARKDRSIYKISLAFAPECAEIVRKLLWCEPAVLSTLKLSSDASLNR